MPLIVLIVSHTDMFLSLSLSLYIYIYIEREREKHTSVCDAISTSASGYIHLGALIDMHVGANMLVDPCV